MSQPREYLYSTTRRALSEPPGEASSQRKISTLRWIFEAFYRPYPATDERDEYKAEDHPLDSTVTLHRYSKSVAYR